MTDYLTVTSATKPARGSLTIDLRTGEYTLYRRDGTVTKIPFEEARTLTGNDIFASTELYPREGQ